VAFDRMMSSTQRVYAQYGIEARFCVWCLTRAVPKKIRTRFNIIQAKTVIG